VKYLVHVEDFFHPDAGYQLNLLARHQANNGYNVIILCAGPTHLPVRLKSFFDFEAISAKDAKFCAQNYNRVQIIRFPTFGYFSGRVFFRPSLFYYAVKLRGYPICIHGVETLTALFFIALSLIFRFRSLIFDTHMVKIASVNRFSPLFNLVFRSAFSPILKAKRFPVVKVVSSNYFNDKYNIDIDQTPVCPLGSDLDHFYFSLEERLRFRKQFQISPNTPLFCYAGKISPDKGIDILLNAIKLVDNLIESPFCFLLVSSSPAVDLLQEMTSSLVNIHLLHTSTMPYSDLRSLYSAVDVCLYAKNCSLSMFDAIACGAQVILPDNEINLSRSCDAFTRYFIDGSPESLATLISCENKRLSCLLRNIPPKYDHRCIPDSVIARISFRESADKFLDLMCKS
jgi:glycosyltransferase involved in cell wall biosynthesis